MRKIAAACVLAGALAMTPTVASAAPPIGGATAHPHHVHLGNGDCVDIDSVLFNVDTRGMHRSSMESGREQGTFHGTCATHSHT